MPTKFPPINPRFPHFLHGGDYNPDQWPEDVWREDMRLMKLANCNTMSVAIFAWARIEPQEGCFDFSWLDKIMDMLAENGAYAVLGTPSGARPAWLSQKYPEVLRVNAERRRILHGGRHNHCLTSPIYREKVGIVNRLLAERYKDHPALLVWHISNEYSGECHCDLCQEAFRAWLQKKYGSLDALNHAWWTAFWSHTFTDWSQIESPSPIGEMSLHGLTLDWKRYTTDQTIDFFKAEIQPLRELTPNVPVTTNFMGLFPGINYPRFAQAVDVVSWDSYPQWHATGPEWELAAHIAFVHDQNRSMKGGRPFMLMESTPSNTNWQPIPKLKRPGMHRLSSLQAVAHGSDTVQYFQWRKSRGSSEKFHGAVVDHVGHENTRVFRDVAQVGADLARLDGVIGSTVKPDVAIILDWENRWAIDGMAGLGVSERRGYVETCLAHYVPFWKRGVAVDVIPEWADFSSYKLLVAPMLYMLQPGVAERIEAFVAGGGTLVTTYWSGIVDENDLVFLGGWPGGGLRKVLGIWDEETDTLRPDERNQVAPVEGNPLGLSGAYEARDYFALIHAEGAQVLATYGSDFYAGRPALTVNRYGQGQAYYMASRNDGRFLDDFYGRLAADLDLLRALPVDLPQGVSAQLREGDGKRYIFVMNFNPEPVSVALDGQSYQGLLSGQPVSGRLDLPGFGVEVLEA